MACTECFSALGVKSRLKIYKFLKDRGESTVTSVVDFVGLRQPTVSYHLKEMKGAGLLHSRKQGKEVFYKVSGACPSGSAACVLSLAELRA